jgi:hypothetical protein
MSVFNRAERRRAFQFRTSDPLAVKFGRVMSDPAMRERCLVLKFGEGTTADIAEGLQVRVTRLKGADLKAMRRADTSSIPNLVRSVEGLLSHDTDCNIYQIPFFHT